MGCFYSKPTAGIYSENYEADTLHQSFHATLQRRTSRVISAVADDADKLHSVSCSSLREATDVLLDYNRDAVINILELREEISNQPDLLRFVKNYFKNSLEVLSFFAALKGCLRKARESQAIIHDALQLFEEVGNKDSGENYKLKALEKFKEFKAVADPFTDEFVKKFRSVCAKQKSMLEELQHRKRELDEKLGSVKAWRKVWGIIYMVAFATVLICSVVLAAVSAPPAPIAAAAAATAAFPPAWEWFKSLWDNYEGAMKEEKDVISNMRRGTSFTIHELESIRFLVEDLEIRIRSMLENAEFVFRNEEEVEVKVGLEEIKNKLNTFTKYMEDLEREVDRCSGEIRKAVKAILGMIGDKTWSGFHWNCMCCVRRRSRATTRKRIPHQEGSRRRRWTRGTSRPAGNTGETWEECT